jgi:hypothetical protein
VSNKFPCCEFCYYRNHRDEEVCDECENGSEFEPDESDRQERHTKPKRSEIVLQNKSRIELVDTREKVVGFCSPTIESIMKRKPE